MNETNSLSLKFQVTTILITTTIIILLISNFMSQFCAQDRSPIFKKYPKHKLELEQRFNYSNVETGLNIENFTEFDTIKNRFTLVGTIWFQYNPEKTAIEDIEKFGFQNGTIIEKTGPFYANKDNSNIGEVSTNNIKIVFFDIKVEFFGYLFFYLFPFEDHKLFLTLVNNSGKIVYTADDNNLKIPSELHVAGWTLKNKKILSGYESLHLGSETSIDQPQISINRPVVAFEFDYFLQALGLIATVLLPLLLIFFIELFTLSLDQEKYKVSLMSLLSSHIGALMAYRFVIDKVSPSVGYLTLADYLFFLFLTLSFFNFILINFGPYLTVRSKKFISIGLQAVVVLAFVYLLNFWIPC